jgi:hypothetical protein
MGKSQKKSGFIWIVLFFALVAGGDAFAAFGLEDLPVNLRVLVFLGWVVLAFFICYYLFDVLMRKEWHPATARVAVLLTLIILAAMGFVPLFIAAILYAFLFFLGGFVLICITMAVLSRRK